MSRWQDMLRSAGKQYDAQAAAHRWLFTGDASEFDDLDDEQRDYLRKIQQHNEDTGDA